MSNQAPPKTSLSAANTEQSGRGILFVVSTPIGNLGDFTPRAIETLKTADLILAEDTRTFGLLAKKFSISTKTISFFEHNEQNKLTQIIDSLLQGQQVCLVSEAGTPTISDPGFKLVRECHLFGISVRSVPGPCAAIAALSISGFETDRFFFSGFLPQRKSKITSALTRAIEADCPTIFYESPYRVIKTLQLIESLDPNREVFIGRELTKFHETTLRGTPTEIVNALSSKGSIKGEIVLILRGRKED